MGQIVVIQYAKLPNVNVLDSLLIMFSIIATFCFITKYFGTYNDSSKKDNVHRWNKKKKRARKSRNIYRNEIKQ